MNEPFIETCKIKKNLIDIKNTNVIHKERDLQKFE